MLCFRLDSNLQEHQTKNRITTRTTKKIAKKKFTNSVDYNLALTLKNKRLSETGLEYFV